MTSYTKHRFHVLDGMRGIAALAVMLFHYHGGRHGIIPRCYSNTFTAVDFFFVLSGFVLCHAYGEKLQAGLWAGDYIVRRIARLFPLAALGLLIGAPAFYALSVAGKHAEYSLHDLIVMLGCNVFFLPYLREWGGHAWDVFPVDHALWSIFFEMLASVAFIWLVRMRSVRLLGLAVASYIALFLAASLIGIVPGFYLPSPDVGWNSTNLLGGFPRVFCSFICGMLLYRLYKLQPAAGLLGFIQRRRIASVPLIYLLLVLTLFFPFYAKGFFSWCAILFIAPFLVIQGGQAKCDSRFLASTSECLGWISYPVYCLHQPIMDAVKVLDKYDGWARDVSWQAIAIPTALVFAALCAASLDRLHVQPHFAAGLRRAFLWGASRAA